MNISSHTKTAVKQRSQRIALMGTSGAAGIRSDIDAA